MAEQELLAQTNEYRKLYPKVVWNKEYIKMILADISPCRIGTPISFLP
jgi:hypothetical protein